MSKTVRLIKQQAVVKLVKGSSTLVIKTVRTAGGSSHKAVVLAVAASTLAQTAKAMTITGDAGGNSIAAITGGIPGEQLTLIFVDGNVALVDDASHSADTINLSGAFLSVLDAVITLLFDGTSWHEVSRSSN